MATALWVIYDIALFVVGFWFLERNLTLKERNVIAGFAALGLAIAVYSGYSDYEQSAVIESLKNGQAYNTGQLNTIGQLSGKTLDLLAGKTDANPKAGADVVASAAAAKIDDLAHKVEDLTRQMKEGQWAPLTPEQWASLKAVFKSGGPASIFIFCNESDCRTLAENIRDAARDAGDESRIISDSYGGFAASGISLFGPLEKHDFGRRLADAIRNAVNSPVIGETAQTPASNQPPHYNLIIGRKPRIEDAVGQGPNPPTNGSFRQGDIWRNAQPKPGGTLGWIWVCDSSGNCAWREYAGISQ